MTTPLWHSKVTNKCIIEQCVHLDDADAKHFLSKKEFFIGKEIRAAFENDISSEPRTFMWDHQGKTCNLKFSYTHLFVTCGGSTPGRRQHRTLNTIEELRSN